MAGLMDGMESGMVKLDQKQRRTVMANVQKHIRIKSKLDGIFLLIIESFFSNDRFDLIWSILIINSLTFKSHKKPA